MDPKAVVRGATLLLLESIHLSQQAEITSAGKSLEIWVGGVLVRGGVLGISALLCIVGNSGHAFDSCPIPYPYRDSVNTELN